MSFGLMLALAAGSAIAGAAAQTPRQTPPPSAANPSIDTPRPIDAVDSVFIEELTWMEVRDAIRAGKKNVIVATGGIEQNGPYLTTGKHNLVLRATTETIARKLGNALSRRSSPSCRKATSSHQRVTCGIPERSACRNRPTPRSSPTSWRVSSSTASSTSS
jgi:hypothetical protein